MAGTIGDASLENLEMQASQYVSFLENLTLKLPCHAWQAALVFRYSLAGNQRKT